MAKTPNDLLQALQENVRELKSNAREHSTQLLNLHQGLGKANGVLDQMGPKKSGWTEPPVLVGLFGVLASVGIAVGSWYFSNSQVVKNNTAQGGRIASLAGQVTALNTRAVQFDAAIRYLARSTAAQDLTEIDKLLQGAASLASSGQVSSANSDLLRARGYVNALKTLQVPAPQEFFTKANEQLNAFESKKAAVGKPEQQESQNTQSSDVRAALASYRSSVVDPIVVLSNGERVTAAELEEITRTSPDQLKGVPVSRFLASAALQPIHNLDGRGGIVAVFSPVSPLQVRDADQYPGKFSIIGNMIITGGRQTLDRFVWRNVVFANMRIEYDGGPIVLDGVRFVNCTFQVNPSKGTPVLNYAVLGESALTTG